MKERCHVDAEELNSGEKVHALFPVPSNKLHSRFVGPYLTEKLNDLNYIMVTPDGRK